MLFMWYVSRASSKVEVMVVAIIAIVMRMCALVVLRRSRNASLCKFSELFGYNGSI